NRPDLLKLPMAAGPKGEPLRQALTELFRSKPRDQWERELAHLDTCVSGVLTPDEALRNEQVVARGLLEECKGGPAFGFPIKFSHAQTRSGAAPRLGADNSTVRPR
ncbi:MAG: CoA transferase, partial [Panacagrimonas sp.]